VKKWETRSELNLHTAFSSMADHNKTRVMGTEFLGRIEANTTEAGFETTGLGETLYRQPLAPLMLNGTRLKKFAEMFQTYDALHLSMTFVPLVPATQNGGVIFTPLYDPDMSITHISTGDELNRIALSMEQSVYSNVYDQVSVIWHKNIMSGLFTRVEDSDARFEIPGDIWVTSGSTYTPFDGSATSIPLYGIWLTYDIVFHNRGLIETDIDLGEGEFTTGALPVNLNTLFYLPSGSVVATTPVCLVSGLASLSPYANQDYILMCKVEGNDPAGQPNWETGGNDITFARDDSTPDFQFTRGTQFYMSYVATENGNLCFHIYTNITSALEGRPDIFWGQAMGGTSGISSTSIAFSFRALPR
jgi:hypothetical protein